MACVDRMDQAFADRDPGLLHSCWPAVKAAATACVAECERLEFNLGVLKTNYHGLEQEIERLRLEEKVGRGYATLLAEAENKNEIACRAYAGMVEGRRREQEKREKAEAELDRLRKREGELRRALRMLLRVYEQTGYQAGYVPYDIARKALGQKGPR